MDPDDLPTTQNLSEYIAIWSTVEDLCGQLLHGLKICTCRFTQHSANEDILPADVTLLTESRLLREEFVTPYDMKNLG